MRCFFILSEKYCMKHLDYQPMRSISWSLRLGFVCLAFGYLIALRYLAGVAWPDSFLGAVYLTTAFVGHFAFLGLIAWCSVILPTALIIPNLKLAKVLITLELGALLLLLIVDTFVFQQYRFHLNMFLWKLILNDTNNEIFAFSNTMKALAVMAIALVMALLFFIGQKLAQPKKSWPHIRLISALLVVYLSANLIHIWADAQYIQSLTRYNRNLPVYYPATATKFMAKHGWLNEEAQQANASLSMNKQNASIQYPLNPLRAAPLTAPMNVLIIAVDSWRADEMNAEVSPNIWDFSQRSMRYNAHFSGSNSTRAGIFSLFYGLPSVYWDAMFANKQGPVLIQQLKDNDYQFGVFTAATLTNPEFDRTVFRDVDNLRLTSEGDTPIARDIDLTEDWLQWIDQHQQQGADKPFFGFLFYDAPHGYSIDDSLPAPFLPEEDINYLVLDNDYDPTLIRNRYRNAVYQDDKLIGQVLSDLQDKQLLDNTIVIITGDHGQEFNDTKHNYWGHNSNFAAPQTHVPFIMHWPGQTANEIAVETSHFDIVPTLLHRALSVTSSERDYSMGGNLLAPVQKNWRLAGSYSSFAVISEGLIIVSSLDGSMHIYDENMDEVSSAALDYSVLSKAMDEMKRFYK